MRFSWKGKWRFNCKANKAVFLFRFVLIRNLFLILLFSTNLIVPRYPLITPSLFLSSNPQPPVCPITPFHSHKCSQMYLWLYLHHLLPPSTTLCHLKARISNLFSIFLVIIQDAYSIGSPKRHALEPR